MNVLKFIIALTIFSLIGVMLSVILSQVAGYGAIIVGTGGIITAALLYLIFRLFH